MRFSKEHKREEVEILERSERFLASIKKECEEIMLLCSKQRQREILARLFSIQNVMIDLRSALEEDSFEQYYALQRVQDEKYEELDWLLANTKTIVRPVGDAVQIISNETLPCGVRVLTTPCDDYKTYKALPKAVALDEREYGLSGWDSDKCVAYFRSDRRVAYCAL